jgi:hypothetical protein
MWYGDNEMTTVLAALGILFGVGYWLVRRGTRAGPESVHQVAQDE